MRCIGCGKNNSDFAAICVKCGDKLPQGMRGRSEFLRPQRPEQQPSGEQEYVEYDPAPAKRRKIVLILAIAAAAVFFSIFFLQNLPNAIIAAYNAAPDMSHLGP